MRGEIRQRERGSPRISSAVAPPRKSPIISGNRFGQRGGVKEEEGEVRN